MLVLYKMPGTEGLAVTRARDIYYTDDLHDTVPKVPGLYIDIAEDITPIIIENLDIDECSSIITTVFEYGKFDLTRYKTEYKLEDE